MKYGRLLVVCLIMLLGGCTGGAAEWDHTQEAPSAQGATAEVKESQPEKKPSPYAPYRPDEEELMTGRFWLEQYGFQLGMDAVDPYPAPYTRGDEVDAARVSAMLHFWFSERLEGYPAESVDLAAGRERWLIPLEDYWDWGEAFYGEAVQDPSYFDWDTFVYGETGVYALNDFNYTPYRKDLYSVAHIRPLANGDAVEVQVDIAHEEYPEAPDQTRIYTFAWDDRAGYVVQAVAAVAHANPPIEFEGNVVPLAAEAAFAGRGQGRTRLYLGDSWYLLRQEGSLLYAVRLDPNTGEESEEALLHDFGGEEFRKIYVLGDNAFAVATDAAAYLWRDGELRERVPWPAALTEHWEEDGNWQNAVLSADAARVAYSDYYTGIFLCELRAGAEPVLLRAHHIPYDREDEELPPGAQGYRVQRFLENGWLLAGVYGYEWLVGYELLDLTGEQVETIEHTASAMGPDSYAIIGGDGVFSYEMQGENGALGDLYYYDFDTMEQRRVLTGWPAMRDGDGYPMFLPGNRMLFTRVEEGGDADENPTLAFEVLDLATGDRTNLPLTVRGGSLEQWGADSAGRIFLMCGNRDQYRRNEWGNADSNYACAVYLPEEAAQ